MCGTGGGGSRQALLNLVCPDVELCPRLQQCPRGRSALLTKRRDGARAMWPPGSVPCYCPLPGCHNLSATFCAIQESAFVILRSLQRLWLYKTMPYLGSCLCKGVALQSAPLQEGDRVSHPHGHWDIYGALAAFLSGSLLLIYAFEFLSLVCKKDYKACTVNLLVLIQRLSCAKPFYCYQH